MPQQPRPQFDPVRPPAMEYSEPAYLTEADVKALMDTDMALSAFIQDLDRRLKIVEERPTVEQTTPGVIKDLFLRYTSRKFVYSLLATIVAGAVAFQAAANGINEWNPVAVVGVIGAVASAMMFTFVEGKNDREKIKTEGSVGLPQ